MTRKEFQVLSLNDKQSAWWCNFGIEVKIIKLDVDSFYLFGSSDQTNNGSDISEPNAVANA
jgi:hypothetical protein